MLKKKLDKIVCRPRAIAVEETTTIRSVTDDGSRSPKFVDCHIDSAQADPASPPSMSIAPRPKMRLPPETIGRKRCWHLDDTKSLDCRANHHVRGELHGGGAQVEAEDRVTPEATHSGVKIADRTPEKVPAESGKDRVSQVSVEGRHRAWLDLAQEAVPHHQVVPGSELVEEPPCLAKVVALVRVRHHHIDAARGGNSREKRGPIPALSHRNHARAAGRGDLRRSVGAPVVRDYHLGINSEFRYGRDRLVDAGADRRRLVEAGHEDA